jgi:hypothetical protein
MEQFVLHQIISESIEELKCRKVNICLLGLYNDLIRC